MRWLLHIAVFFFVFHGRANDGSHAPPGMQKTPGLNFVRLDRQPAPPAYIFEGIKQLESKKRAEWNQKDSLFYAYELTYLGNYDKALLYFLGVKTDTIREKQGTQLLQLTLRKTKRYDRLRDVIIQSSDAKKVIELRLRLITVRQFVEDRTWNFQDSLIFPFLKDSTHYQAVSNLDYLKNQLLPLANDLKAALEYDVLLSDVRDPILSSAFKEYGDFLTKYAYASSAYIAYSIARHYDKRNSTLAKTLRESKRRLDNENYLIPSIREVFGKIRTDYYDFKTYSELDLNSLEDTEKFITFEELMQFKKKPDLIPGIDSEIIYFICIFLLLIGIILFVKSKR